MKPIIHYCVIKTYKGIFTRRHAGNAHIFFIPISKNESLVLGVVGFFEDKPNDPVFVLQGRIMMEYVNVVIDEAIKEGKGNFIVVESLPCTPKTISKGNYQITLEKKGSFIKSSFKLLFEPEYSTSFDNVYSTEGGKFELEDQDIDPKTMKMTLTKHRAKMQSIPSMKIITSKLK